MGAGGVAGFSGRLWFLAPSDREHASVLGQGAKYLSSVSSLDGPLAARDPGIDQGIPGTQFQFLIGF